MTDVIIVGGGAAGLVAAIVAARAGQKVCILERLNRIGKKILVTGNGRCNMTSTNLNTSHYYTQGNPKKLDVSFNQIGYTETLAFFEALGIMPLIEGDKVYPLSEQATSVLDVLRLELEKLEVEVLTEVQVASMSYKKNGWHLADTLKRTYTAKKVIVATGGLANASLGCDGSGYQLLKAQGHRMTETYPILVHLVSPSPYCKMMKGTKVKANVSAVVEGRVMKENYGEVLFTEDGLSGPPIFQLSRYSSRAHIERKAAQIHLDLFPQYEEEALLALLYERIARCPERPIELLLMGMLHKRVIIPVLKASRIDGVTRSSETLEYEEVMRIVRTLKQFVFETQGTRGYKYAQVTAGGIRLDEIDLKTMASLEAKDLYIAGEVLDVDGDCGGFNLQWAWTSGMIAGESVSRNED